MAVKGKKNFFLFVVCSTFQSFLHFTDIVQDLAASSDWSFIVITVNPVEPRLMDTPE